MPPRRVVLSVSLYCPKCRIRVHGAVARLSGVEQVNMDAERGVLTVIGDVEPALLKSRIERTGRRAVIISVGRPDRLETPDRPPPPPPPCCCHDRVSCRARYINSFNDGNCTIL